MGFKDKDGVVISKEQVVPMDAIAAGVCGLRITFVNVFGVMRGDGSWVLIDAAVPFSAGMIKSWAEKNFGRPPRAIILTHGHFDHVGAAKDLAEEWNVPVYAHCFEFPYLTGIQEYAPPNAGAGGGMMSLMSPMLPRGPIDLTGRLHALPEDGGEFAEMLGWRVIHTPGHTPGHVSLWREKDGVLLVGDAFCTTKPESFFEASIAQKPELHGPPAYFTPDMDAAKASVEMLAELPVKVVAPGHGKPLRGENVARDLKELAMRFEAIAVPENVKKQNVKRPLAA